MKLKYIAIIISVLIIPSYCYASQTYFDFSVGSYLIEENKEVEVQLAYYLSGFKEEDFTIRPLVENGSIFIFNPKKDLWVNSFSAPYTFPSLAHKVKVKLSGLTFENSQIWFEIRNIKTGKSYLTPRKMFWTKKIYDGYIEYTNESINKYSIIKPNENSLVLKDTWFIQISNNKNKPINLDKIPKKYFLILDLCLFTISFIIGFLSKQKHKTEMVKSICD